MRTPWGKSQSVRQVGEGIVRVDTAGHGGYKLDRKRNALVPEYMRAEGGWYEEDEAWCIVALVFPAFFPADAVESAFKTFRNGYPEAFEAFTGTTLKEGESFARDRQLFEARHRGDLVVTSASSGRDIFRGRDIPSGFVQVTAVVGGRVGYRLPEGPERLFLVPDEEYKGRGPHGFVVDPAKHREVSA